MGIDGIMGKDFRGSLIGNAGNARKTAASDGDFANRMSKYMTFASGGVHAPVKSRAAYETYESANYKIVPDNEAGCFTIYNKQGERIGAFDYSDIKIRQDVATGCQFLISEHGTMCYDAMVFDKELQEDLKSVMNIEKLQTETLQGFSLKTHKGMGIQYLIRDGEEGRGGKVLLQNEEDVRKYEALAETYFNKYSKLIKDKNAAYIYADLEIKGLAQHTERGILSMGYDGISYHDNLDDKRNWTVVFSGDAYQRIFAWLQDNRGSKADIEKISTWINAAAPVSTGTGKEDAADRTASSSADALEKPVMNYWERAFEQIGANAPERVKQAWIGAAEAVGADGMGTTADGKLGHISQLMVQRLIRIYRGEKADDILGSTVQSAVRAVEDALYDLTHPLDGNYGRTPEQLKNREREKKFYQEFLKRLRETV